MLMGAQWETGDRVAGTFRDGRQVAGIVRFAGIYSGVGVQADRVVAKVGICEWGYHVRLTDDGQGRTFYGVIDQADGATAWGSRVEAEGIAAAVNVVQALERYGPDRAAHASTYASEAT